MTGYLAATCADAPRLLRGAGRRYRTPSLVRADPLPLSTVWWESGGAHVFTVTNSGSTALTGVSLTDELEGISEVRYGGWPGAEVMGLLGLAALLLLGGAGAVRFSRRGRDGGS